MASWDEPMLKRYNVVAARDAVADVWDEAALASVLAAMPEPERTILCAPMADWVPVRVPIQLSFAVWEGPCRRDKPSYFRYLHRHTDMTNGRIRKALLGLVKPEMIFKRAPDFWRSEHTAGVLETHLDADGKSGLLALKDHPYVEFPQGRGAIAETFRYLLELTRANTVTETHAFVAPNSVEVKLRWT